MTWQAKIKADPKVPKTVKKVIDELDLLREAISKMEMLIQYGESEQELTETEVKRMDKAVTVIKAGLKIFKKSVKARGYGLIPKEVLL